MKLKLPAQCIESPQKEEAFLVGVGAVRVLPENTDACSR